MSTSKPLEIVIESHGERTFIMAKEDSLWMATRLTDAADLDRVIDALQRAREQMNQQSA